MLNLQIGNINCQRELNYISNKVVRGKGFEPSYYIRMLPKLKSNGMLISFKAIDIIFNIFF
jgi:hypothetical protein